MIKIVYIPRQKLTLVDGYTLIEVLISIAIIVLFVGVSLAGYARFNQRQGVVNSGQTLKNALRDVQSRAFNGEQDCSVCDCSSTSSNSLEGWYVDFSQHSFYGQCFGAVPSPFPTILIPLPTEIVVTPALTGGSDKILFKSNPPGTAQSGTICVSDGRLPETYYKIIVEYSGQISDAGALVSSCP